MSDAPSLELIFRQQQRVLTEIGSMRADMGVMVAILQRLDGTMAGLVNEVRAMHSRHDRLTRRVEALEPEILAPPDDEELKREMTPEKARDRGRLLQAWAVTLGLFGYTSVAEQAERQAERWHTYAIALAQTKPDGAAE